MRLNTVKIKKELKRKGWTYAEFAKRLKVKRQAVWQYVHEGQKRNFTLRTIEKIAKALDLDPKDLLV